MAIIRTSVEHGRHYVSVTGEFAPREVRRLEQACGPALEQRELRLTVNLESAGLPPAALEFIRRLSARGARVTGPGSQSVTGRDDDLTSPPDPVL